MPESESRAAVERVSARIEPRCRYCFGRGVIADPDRSHTDLRCRVCRGFGFDVMAVVDERNALRSQSARRGTGMNGSSDNARAAVTAQIVVWLRCRTGAHGGGFTSADDVADAIKREFGA